MIKKITTNNKYRLISILLFLLYLIILFYLVFRSSDFGRTNFQRSINTQAFKTIINCFKYCSLLSRYTIINIYGNLVAFIPMGFFIPLIFKRLKNFFVMLIVFIMASFFIELLQYVFAVGAADVDDIILNSIGGVLGYLLYVVINKIFK